MSETNQKLLAAFGVLALVTLFAVAATNEARSRQATETADTPVESKTVTKRVAVYEWQTFDTANNRKDALADLRHIFKEWKVSEIKLATLHNMVPLDGRKDAYTADPESEQPVYADEKTVLRIAHNLPVNKHFIIDFVSNGDRYAVSIYRLPRAFRSETEIQVKTGYRTITVADSGE